MRATLLSAEPGRVAGTRIILIPGAYQGSKDFIAAGFEAALRDSQLAIDLVLLDLEMEHLTDRSMLDELHGRLMPEARLAGCTQLWLGGISLGAFLALLYAERHPGDCDGLLLLAPYPGNRMILGDIEKFLHASEGQPEPAELAEERRVWRFLREPPPQSAQLWLGFGSADRYADAHRQMARSIPGTQVHEIPGVHDWPVWLRLWKQFLSGLDARMVGAR